MSARGRILKTYFSHSEGIATDDVFLLRLEACLGLRSLCLFTREIELALALACELLCVFFVDSDASPCAHTGDKLGSPRYPTRGACGPAGFALTASACAAPNIQRSIHRTVLEGTPHLDKQLHRLGARLAVGGRQWGFTRW